MHSRACLSATEVQRVDQRETQLDGSLLPAHNTNPNERDTVQYTMMRPPCVVSSIDEEVRPQLVPVLLSLPAPIDSKHISPSMCESDCTTISMRFNQLHIVVGPLNVFMKSTVVPCTATLHVKYNVTPHFSFGVTLWTSQHFMHDIT